MQFHPPKLSNVRPVISNPNSTQLSMEAVILVEE